MPESLIGKLNDLEDSVPFGYTKEQEHAHERAVVDCIEIIRKHSTAMDAEMGIIHYVPVGQFLLSHGRSNPAKVWIEIANDGEGGEFNQSDLEPVLKEFYAKHF
jgi:hypothetical protein